MSQTPLYRGIRMSQTTMSAVHACIISSAASALLAAFTW